MPTRTALETWVATVAEQVNPERIHWCDGSEGEKTTLIAHMLAAKSLLALNADTYPHCTLYRSAPNDVARTEQLTYVCTENANDAGPNNQWMNHKEAHALLDRYFSGAMRGRTMYVIPYWLGPYDSPYGRAGIEITDSPYVVLNMRIMTKIGKPALAAIENSKTLVKGIHSEGELDPKRRLIAHFPEELLIRSFGSGYGGNALLAKKCHALRVASWQARNEGWLAEHMLIAGIENPQGEVRYIAAAFPSACGKTNLAMLVPPESIPGWKVWTVGDDIAWLHREKDGRVYAINPEAGYFGVVPGTSPTTNPNAYQMIQRDTIFTNVALTANNCPWWEGKPDGVPTIDWQGRPYQAAHGPAAHPNSRFTVSAKANPNYSPAAEELNGVPISAILFGGRQASLAPLVYQARDWQHGVFIGATMSSSATAASDQSVSIRRDPMAMQPFCGYHFGDYWSHWLKFGAASPEKLPAIFHVNWFRQNNQGSYLWPGFGENLRVLQWILGRCEKTAEAQSRAIGLLPTPNAINRQGLALSEDTVDELLKVDVNEWREEFSQCRSFLNRYQPRVPNELFEELKKSEAALE